jgi:ABC-2 type transport system ATP-binding protein
LTIRASQVCFRFSRDWSLGPITLTIPGGAVTALVGPNGAGKTTFMRILSGLMVPDKGSVALEGLAARGRSFLRKAVSFVGSEPAFPEGARIADIVRYKLQVQGIPRKGQEAHISMIEERLGQRRSCSPHDLSRGQRLGLAIELALAGDPGIVILDEPWAGLDPVATEVLLGRLKRTSQRGSVVLVSSHDVYSLPQISSNYAFLSGGKLKAAGTIDQLRAVVNSQEAAPADVLRAVFRAMAKG